MPNIGYLGAPSDSLRTRRLIERQKRVLESNTNANLKLNTALLQLSGYSADSRPTLRGSRPRPISPVGPTGVSRSVRESNALSQESSTTSDSADEDLLRKLPRGILAQDSDYWFESEGPTSEDALGIATIRTVSSDTESEGLLSTQNDHYRDPYGFEPIGANDRLAVES